MREEYKSHKTEKVNLIIKSLNNQQNNNLYYKLIHNKLRRMRDDILEVIDQNELMPQ